MKNKVTEIKNKIIDIIEKRKDELILNNVKIEINNNSEYSYDIILDKENYSEEIIVHKEQYGPYKFVFLQIVGGTDTVETVYIWHDNEKTTIESIEKNINNSLDYFLLLN